VIDQCTIKAASILPDSTVMFCSDLLLVFVTTQAGGRAFATEFTAALVSRSAAHPLAGSQAAVQNELALRVKTFTIFGRRRGCRGWCRFRFAQLAGDGAEGSQFLAAPFYFVDPPIVDGF
jgi:hypothetical protein